MTKKFPPTPKGTRRIAVYKKGDYWVLIGITKETVRFYEWDGIAKLWNTVYQFSNYKNLLK